MAYIIKYINSINCTNEFLTHILHSDPLRILPLYAELLNEEGKTIVYTLPILEQRCKVSSMHLKVNLLASYKIL